ncbi:hypothetical protein Hena1_02390 [Erwinia phage Hena1]|uniref:Uncharacterized protein n=1 Tax=Erwinia phage Hena1 TaxID=2678601 RepID=A0A6B9JA20_9CAUD|nr:hypothetical protein HWC84_gp125 [Erwinia phage Hena1]QGZ16389.1 hypothetical protein Hena1_02390 [Erwinia phage Hena1]
MKPWTNTKIALDFDETYTVHPDMWDSIVVLMQGSGCDVRFVTYRYENAPGNSDIIAAAEKLGIKIIFCNYFQKAQVTALHGWIPDIWIDDMPVLIPVQAQLEGMVQGIKRSDRTEEIQKMTTQLREAARKLTNIAELLK